MNILGTIVAKIATIITAILISVGIWNVPTPPVPIQPVPEMAVEIPAVLEESKSVPEKPVVKAPVPEAIMPQISSTLTVEPTPVPIPTPIPPPQIVYVPMYVSQSTSEPAPVPTPPVENPPVETPKPEPSKAAIIIFSPIPGKGIGPRPDPITGEDMGYVASSTVENESNYIVLGLIVYDDAGVNTKTAVVTITATDASQNKILNGTGNMKKVYEDGAWKEIYYYPFNYEFHFAGQHTITFTTNGLTASVDLTVK